MLIMLATVQTHLTFVSSALFKPFFIFMVGYIILRLIQTLWRTLFP